MPGGFGSPGFSDFAQWAVNHRIVGEFDLSVHRQHVHVFDANDFNVVRGIAQDHWSYVSLWCFEHFKGDRLGRLGQEQLGFLRSARIRAQHNKRFEALLWIVHVRVK